MRKIVFLDIDGVMLPVEWAKRQQAEPELREIVFSPGACQVLFQICEQNQAEIVISSTWRMMHARPWFEQHLKDQGCPIKVAGMTANSVRLRETRGDQIAEWIQKNKGKTKGNEINSFVILDDDDDMYPNLHRLVQVDPERGLQEEHIAQVTEILAWDLGGHRIWTSANLSSPKTAAENLAFPSFDHLKLAGPPPTP